MKNNRTLIILVSLQCLLTIVHHLYGEFFLYQDGVRLHIVLFAPPALLLTLAPLKLHPNTFGRSMFIFWSMLLWVFVIGLFEGGWNHPVVDVLSLLNLTEKFSWAFIRAVPGNLIFEITGISQFFLSLVSGAYLLCLQRAKRIGPHGMKGLGAAYFVSAESASTLNWLTISTAFAASFSCTKI